jgi:hypothetical protein
MYCVSGFAAVSSVLEIGFSVEEAAASPIYTIWVEDCGAEVLKLPTA